MALELAWYDGVGLLGTAMVLVAFALLQAGRLSGTGLAYQLLNLLGAVCLLLSLFGGFNVSVFALQLAWCAVSLYGIARSLRARSKAAA